MVEVVPDPDILASELGRMAVEVKNVRAPLEAAIGIIGTGINRRFREQTDPSGEPWAPWSEAYAVRAEREQEQGIHLGQILERSLELKYRASAAFDISGESVFFMWGDLPEYGAIQNFGGYAGKGALIPARAFVGIDEMDAAAITEIAGRFVDTIIE